MYYTNANDPTGDSASVRAVDSKIAQNRSQIDYVTTLMQANIQKTLERDVNLNRLELNAENLQSQAEVFKTNTIKTKRFFSWKSKKWGFFLFIFVLTLIALIILAIVLGVKYNKRN
jgi:hypothetical protein